MSKDFEQNLTKIEQFSFNQTAIGQLFDLHAQGMSSELADEFIQGIQEGRAEEVVRTLAQVGSKLIK